MNRTHLTGAVAPTLSFDWFTHSGVDKPLRIVRGMAADETAAAVIKAGRLVPAGQSAGDVVENEPNDQIPDQTPAETETEDESEAPPADDEGAAEPAESEAPAPDASDDTSSGEPEPD